MVRFSLNRALVNQALCVLSKCGAHIGARALRYDYIDKLSVEQSNVAASKTAIRLLF